MCWTGVRWGETLGGRHTGGGSDLGGRGSCPLREVSTGQGGRQGDVVGGLLSTEEGVDRLRSWRALAPREVWHQGRCQQAEIMESPSTARDVEVIPIPRDCRLLGK